MFGHILKIETQKDNVQVQVNQRRALLNSFTSGMLFGVGSAVGATFVFGLLIFVLGQLDTVPFVGRYISNIIDYIQSSTTP